MAKAKYVPFGNKLNPGVAIIQAANALDVAAEFAVSSRDSEALVRIAREWVEMSSHLGFEDDGESDEPGDENEERSRSFGFSTVSDIQGEEDAECEC